MKIAYYITSHGFGHALRSSVICSKFSNNVELVLRTKVPEAFFRQEIKRPFSYTPAQFDCGCIQSDGVTVDIQKTLETYRAIAYTNENHLLNEMQWCVDNKIDVIVSDIVPFAFEVAHNALIPSVAVTNFTWWDIYERYCADQMSFLPYLGKIKYQYSLATMLLELMPSMPMHYFKKRKPVGPVGRVGRDIRTDIRARYSLQKDKHLGLIYTGTFGMNEVLWEKLEQFTEWEFIGLYPLPNSPSNFHVVSSADFRYQDCIASVDCMISKIGYGVYAECVLNGTPIVYLPRKEFVEYPVLEKAIIAWGGGYPLSHDEYYGLNWDSALHRISQSSRLVPRASNAAEFCAQEIENITTAE